MDETSSGAQTARPNPSHFWRGQVWPRRRALLHDHHLWLAGTAAIVGAWATWRTSFKDTQVSTLAAAGLAYAALSIGACITGSVLALTIGSDRQRQQLATQRPWGNRFSHFSELMFVFTWGAVTQFAVVVAAMLGFVLGGESVVGPNSPLPTHIVLVVLGFWVVFYGLLELFTVISTISQVGVVIDSAARRDQRAGIEPAGSPLVPGEATGAGSLHEVDTGS